MNLKAIAKKLTALAGKTHRSLEQIEALQAKAKALDDEAAAIMEEVQKAADAEPVPLRSNGKAKKAEAAPVPAPA